MEAHRKPSQTLIMEASQACLAAVKAAPPGTAGVPVYIPCYTKFCRLFAGAPHAAKVCGPQDACLTARPVLKWSSHGRIGAPVAPLPPVQSVRVGAPSARPAANRWGD